MANGVSTVNTSKLKQFKSSFSKEQSTLKDSHSNFKNSYLKKSEDVYIQKMAKSIDGIYTNIETAYSTILKWWSEYIENIEKVDKSLKQDSETFNNTTKVNETTKNNDSNFNSLGFDNLFSATKTAAVEGGKKIIEKEKNRQQLHYQLYEFDPELANSFDIVMKEHPEYDYERTLKKCMNDEGYANIIKQNAININEAEAKKEAEEYAKNHPIKSTAKKVGKKFNHVVSAVSEIAEDSAKNLGLMGKGFLNGVESSVQNVDIFLYKKLYDFNLISEEVYLETLDIYKEYQLIDDEDLNNAMNEQGINDFGPSKVVYNVVEGLGESSIPILASMVGGGVLGAAFGFVDGYGKSAKEATEHQKEFIDNQAIVLSQDIKEGTITYMYQGCKVVVDSSGEVISNQKMCSKEYYKLLADYHDMGATDKAALLGGLWGGFSFGAGTAISKAVIVTNPIVNSTIKIAIDGVFGGAETPIQSAIKTTYMKFYYDENGNMVTVDEDSSFSDKYKNAFESNGGWDAVKQGAIMGASMSFALGEASNIDAALNYKKMLSTNPKAFAESLIKQGVSKEAAYAAIKEISPNELISQKMKLDEHFKYNKDGSVEKVIEPEKLKKEINKIVDKASGKDVDFTIASDLKASVSNAKQKISNIADNIKLKETFKLILADDSGKVDFNAFGKKKKIEKYNDIISNIKQADDTINIAIEKTLKKQNAEINQKNIDILRNHIENGEYDYITSADNWRDVVKDLQQLKQEWIIDKNKLEKYIDVEKSPGLQKNNSSNKNFSDNVDNKLSNINSMIDEYNRITNILNASESRLNDAIEATLKKQGYEVNSTNIAKMKEYIKNKEFGRITKDDGWRDIVIIDENNKEFYLSKQKDLAKSIEDARMPDSQKNNFYNDNVNNKSSNIDLMINEYNIMPDKISTSDAIINEAIAATLKKQNVPINPENIAKMKEYIKNKEFGRITKDDGWREKVINYSNLSENQKNIINKISSSTKNGENIKIEVSSTAELSSNMLSLIENLDLVDFVIYGGFANADGDLKLKYDTARYKDRITYKGIETKFIIDEIERLQSMVDMSLPTKERARQIYDIVSTEYSYMHDYANYSQGHKITASLRGITPYNLTGKKGLVCAGYAQVYKELCNRCNIKCDYIRGLGYGAGSWETHAWNIVLGENGELIPVDVTWGGDRNFGKSEAFNSRHKADDNELFKKYD